MSPNAGTVRAASRARSPGPAPPPGAPGPAGPLRRAAGSLAPPVALSTGLLALLLTHPRPPYPSDQLHYFAAARALPAIDTIAFESHQALRVGLTAPVRLAIAVFGYSPAAYWTVPVCSAVLLLLATYAIGTVLFARPVGVAAAAVTAAVPTLFMDSTELLPDLTATALLAAAVAVAAAVHRGRLVPRWYVLAGIGLLLGWSYLVREFIVFVWPVVVVLLWRRVGPRRLLLAVAGPVLAVVAAELIWCWLATGDPLARLAAAAGHGSAPSDPRVGRTYRDKPLATYLLRLPAGLRAEPGGRWLVGMGVVALAAGIAGVAGTALRFAARARTARLAAGPGATARPPVPLGALALLLAWGAALWVPLTLLGGVLDPHAPRLRLQLIRYWYPLFPAIALGAAAAVWLLAGALTRTLTRTLPVPRWAAIGRGGTVLAGGAIVVVAMSPAWWDDPGTRAGGATQMEAFRTWMARDGAAAGTLWADSRTAQVARVYRSGTFGGAGFTARVLAWPDPAAGSPAGGLATGGPSTGPPGPPGAPVPGDVLLLYDSVRGRLCGHCRARAREMFGTPPRPPPGWREVWRTSDGVVRVYRLAPS